MSFTVDIYPGATISVLRGKMRKVDISKNDLIVIFGGICNVTRIAFLPYRAAVPRHASVEETIQRYRGIYATPY